MADGSVMAEPLEPTGRADKVACFIADILAASII